MDHEFALRVMLQLAGVLSDMTKARQDELQAEGCFCEWDRPEELLEWQVEEEAKRPMFDCYYHLLIVIPPEIQAITGYPYMGIGTHINHTHDCPLRAKYFSKLN